MQNLYDIALILWFINIVEMFVIAFIFLREYRKENTRFYLGVTIFYLFFMVARLCEVIRFFFHPTGTPLDPPYTVIGFDFWLKTSYTIFSYIGLTIIYYVLERYVFTKTKFFFTILVPITTVISIWFTLDVVNYDLLFTITIPFYLLILFGIVGMYIYLAINTTGNVRKNSIMITIGILLFELGLVFALPEAQANIFSTIPSDVLIILAPVLSILGVILQIRGFKTSVS